MDKTTQKIDAQVDSSGSVVPKIQIPGYKILRELGHGGMAHVYLAIQESFGREVALKILSPHLAGDEEFSKRFLREARIVSQLSHPNIVTVYDAGKHGQHHYMSMEYIAGKDLKQLKDSISREEAIHIVKDVAQALDFAGKKGIVHRDVKPENIMIHQSDHRVVLMDFGIAHGDDVTQGMTQTGKAIGTPHFMSPEQTKGLKVDHRSDIYSLGIVLFQLLSGNLPFDADSAVAVGIKHLTAPIPLLPAGLEIFQAIVNRCLSKEPQHRYQKAAEIIEALNKITNEQLENINTQAIIFKNEGADQSAETQIGEVPQNPKRKMPELVFPSRNKITIDEDVPEIQKPGTRRRNLLFLLLFATIIYAANEKQKELTQFWGYEALPKIAKQFPDLFPASYSQYWVDKQEREKPKNIVAPALTEPSIALSTDDKSEVKTPIIKDRLTELNEGLASNPKNAFELATIYKERLLLDAQDPVAIKGLKSLREWYVKQISLAFATENIELARQHINLMKKSFPVATQAPNFIRLERKVAFLERLNLHFIKAENHFKAGALSKPINKNALNEINIILKLSPNNEDANKFMAKIIQTYLDKTTQLQQQGNIHNAILMVEEGIAALNNNSILVDKRKQLKSTIKHNKNISFLLKQAKKYLTADQLINPQAYNAYDVYKKILEKEKGNLRAKAGLKTIHQLLAKKITAAIQEGNLEASENNLRNAIQKYGRSSLLASVQLKLNDALDEIAPKIQSLKLDVVPVKSLNKSNPKDLVLKLNHTLYAGFNFINFDMKTTWLDVTLFDQTKKTKIAQKPVVISSQFGEQFFEINLPKVFWKNRYKLEIKLKNKVLISRIFSVKN